VILLNLPQNSDETRKMLPFCRQPPATAHHCSSYISILKLDRNTEKVFFKLKVILRQQYCIILAASWEKIYSILG
jgi:hypothetical protein